MSADHDDTAASSGDADKTPPHQMPRPCRFRLSFLLIIAVYPLITTLLYILMPLTSTWETWHRTLVITRHGVADRVSRDADHPAAFRLVCAAHAASRAVKAGGPPFSERSIHTACRAGHTVRPLRCCAPSSVPVVHISRKKAAAWTQIDAFRMPA